MCKYKKSIDKYGVERFELKPIMKWLSDNIDLNKMWIAYREGAFSKKEFKKFYRDMGYSVDGFYEIWSNK